MTAVFEKTFPINLPDWVSDPPLRRSSLLDYLPVLYAGDDLLNRLLLILEDTFTPLQAMVDNLHYYFDPLIAPPEALAWLATWVNLVLDEGWSLEKRRKLVRAASDLYSRRGTRGGLIEYLKLYTDEVAEIAEYVDGMVLGPETRLGINTTIAGRERHSFTVTLRLKGINPAELASKEATIRRIIESEKPAHTAYRLNLLTDRPHAPETPPASGNGGTSGDKTGTGQTELYPNGGSATHHSEIISAAEDEKAVSNDGSPENEPQG